MEIYSFSGPSGTGKSSFALEFAHQYDIEAIIDDGLLIINGDVKAGTSAKFEKIVIKAVKRAIFTDEEHVAAVRECLIEEKPEKLLIIGTSDKMTKLIASRLNIGEINHFHHIENFRTAKQMKMARFVRQTEGKHIMPVPVVQVQQNFFQRLVMKGFEIFSNKREKIGETTIVQPDFHHELLHFHKKDFLAQIRKSCEDSKVVNEIHKITFTLYPLPKTKVTLTFNNEYADQMVQHLTELQNEINEQFDKEFEIEFETVNIEVIQIATVKENTI